MKTTQRFEKIDINKLVPYARNARTHSKEQILQLRASLREFGFVNPVIVDNDMNIIAGHGRIMAAKEEGIAEVPCVFAEHLTEAQKKAYILADNRLALSAGWDDELLALEFADLKDLGFDVDAIGFEPAEIEKLFNTESESEPAEVTEDDFDVDEVADDSPVMLGDIWTLGKHRLMCGDSTDLDSVKKLMSGKLANISWCDPPWNVDYGGAAHPSWKQRSIMNDKMSTEDFGKFLLAAFTAQAAVSEAGCMAYIAMSAQEWHNVMKATADAGYHWSSTIIWVKDSLVLSRKDYHTQYEPLYYGWLSGKNSDKRLCPLEDRQQSDVWNIPRPKKSEEHPTMKPVELVGRSLQNSSKVGDIVLDLFGGSGTTLIAAEQTGRISRLMELDPRYAWVIVERFHSNFPDEKITVERNGEVLSYDDVRQSV